MEELILKQDNFMEPELIALVFDDDNIGLTISDISTCCSITLTPNQAKQLSDYLLEALKVSEDNQNNSAS